MKRLPRLCPGSSRRLLALSGVLLVSITAACTSPPKVAQPTLAAATAAPAAPPAPTATQVPAPPAATAAPPPPTAPPKPTAAAAAQSVLNQPVLGGPRTAWTAAKGSPSKGVIGDRFGNVEAGAWQQDGTGNARTTHLELLLSSAVPVARAREQAKALHPPDAKVIRTYTAPTGQTVEVFQSRLLAEALASLGEDAWDDEPPGTFIQIAERGTPTTTRVVIGVGNNP